MKILGITGNSGSGKSFLSKLFQNQGGFVIDTDRLGHEALLSNSSVFDEVIDYFGNEILINGEIDRKKLGDIVFSNKIKLKKLEEISHRYIKDKIAFIIENLKNSNGYNFIIIDGALLIESNIYKICDLFILAEASYETKLIRIVERDSITAFQAQKRLENQLEFENFKEFFDFTINTDESDDKIKSQVKIIVNEIN